MHSHCISQTPWCSGSQRIFPSQCEWDTLSCARALVASPSSHRSPACTTVVGDGVQRIEAPVSLIHLPKGPGCRMPKSRGHPGLTAASLVASGSQAAQRLHTSSATRAIQKIGCNRQLIGCEGGHGLRVRSQVVVFRTRPGPAPHWPHSPLPKAEHFALPAEVRASVCSRRRSRRPSRL